MSDQPINIGDTKAVLSEIGYDFDPDSGDVYTYAFTGSEASIRAASTAWRSTGARLRMSHQGALWRLDVRISYDPQTGQEIPVDTWETDVELAHEDFYASPKILQAAGSENTLSRWRKEIEDAIKKGVPLDGAFVANDPELVLYNERARGTEATEVERPILRRVRYVSPRYASPGVIDVPPLIWTTNRLIQVFGIPPVIQFKLPTTPAYTPSNTVWGWKRRQNTSRWMRAIAKFEESMSWYFAAWSTTRYTIIS